MTSNRPDETVGEILTRKRASVRSAPLEKGAPSWEELFGWTWADVERAAKAGRPGFRTIRKLLSDSRFDR